MLKLAELFLKLSGRWGSIITGEWWITQHGEAEYADQDVGDIGHEMIAANYMIDKDLLLGNLQEYWKDQFDSGNIDEQEYNEQIENLIQYSDDNMSSGDLFFNEFIPDEAGTKTVGSLTKWNDIKSDIRAAFAKYDEAIMVINTSFLAWKVTEDAINRMQRFIWEQIEDEEIMKGAEITIEEAGTRKNITINLDQFLTIKYPAELWRIPA